MEALRPLNHLRGLVVARSVLIASAKDSLAVEDCLTEFDNHLRSMSPEDHQTALDGLRWYAEHFQEDI